MESVNIITVDHSIYKRSIEFVTNNGTHRIYCSANGGAQGNIVYYVRDTIDGVDYVSIGGAYINFFIHDDGTTTISGRASIKSVDLATGKVSVILPDGTANNKFYIYKIYEIIE